MNTGRLVSYAALGAATKALTLPLISYLPPFYATQAGLPIATVGLLFMAARFWDVLIDPVVGFVMDRYNAPLGRRKFWIVLSLPLILGSMWPLFVPGENANVFSVAMLLFVFYVGWTLLTMSHAAWPAELTTRSEQRVRLVAWREWAGVIGMICAVALPAVLEQTSKPALGDQLRVIAMFVAVVPMLMRLSVSRGIANGFALAMVGAAVMTLMFAIAPQGSFIAAACINGLVGFFTGGYQFNLNAAMVEIADEHRRESNQDAVAMHFALLALTNKIGYAVAVGVTYVMLGVFGYSTTGTGGQAPPTALLLTAGLVVPALLFVSAAVAFYQSPRSPRLVHPDPVV